MSFKFLNEGRGGNALEVTPIDTFIDPVSKIRVSQPSNLIDTDFEYGLQPTKWETVEIINNTPSFFSRTGDTTIPDIVSIITSAGTREITVTTAFPHNLAVGIPIRVSGTKSLTADGSYIINATPSPTTFTYLAIASQPETISIFDLYTSIITGEFFQGSQITVNDAEGITTFTDQGASTSVLTVKTPTKHGFGINTPFYFLNLNSTISQEFESQNTASLSFDPTNSATAQTFDGSNTLLQTPIDLSNSATTATIDNSITSVSSANSTITVAIATGNEDRWAALKVGSPLYYNVGVGSGYFQSNPRGIVFIKSVDAINVDAKTATFQVSELPNGTALPIVAGMTGTFVIADRARTFAGNNIDAETQIDLNVEVGTTFNFDGGNQGYVGQSGQALGFTPRIFGFTGSTISLLIEEGVLEYYPGAMLKYFVEDSEPGANDAQAANGLIENATYFVLSFASAGSPGLYTMTIAELPGGSAISATGGVGIQKFKQIGVSVDKNIVHIKDSNFDEKDMLEYTAPENGAFEYQTEESQKRFFFVQTAYDSHNYEISLVSQSFVPVEYLVIAGGGSGGVRSNANRSAGGGGAGGFRTSAGTSGGGASAESLVSIQAGSSFTVTVGAGGAGVSFTNGGGNGNDGSNSVFASITSQGGGRGAQNTSGNGFAGGSGGGTGGTDTSLTGGNGTTGQGFKGGNSFASAVNTERGGGGGGGAAQAGGNGALNTAGNGGNGVASSITGSSVTRAGGGGGTRAGNITGTSSGGSGGGTGGVWRSGSAGTSSNATVNTGSGSGGVVTDTNHTATSGNGGSGVVICKLPEGNVFTSIGVGLTYNVNVVSGQPVYTFTAGTDTVELGEGYVFDYLVIAGGGSGGVRSGGSGRANGGGGAGGFRTSAGTSGGGASAESAVNIKKGLPFTVTVGAGGASLSRTNATGSGNNGSNSVFASITSIGGGGGGRNGFDGLSGGSGGGAGVDTTQANLGGAGTSGQGFVGGNAFFSATANERGAGGGGGAGQAGGNAVANVAGNGGNGVASTITGSPETRAGGGGGTRTSGAGNTTSSGGSGGGTGGVAVSSGPATSGNASVNTGSGSGGAMTPTTTEAATSGSGGSGIVVLKYPSSLTLTVGAGLTSTTTTSGGFKITQFTAGTDTVTVG
jgi:hypothetical protein